MKASKYLLPERYIKKKYSLNTGDVPKSDLRCVFMASILFAYNVNGLQSTGFMKGLYIK